MKSFLTIAKRDQSQLVNISLDSTRLWPLEDGANSRKYGLQTSGPWSFERSPIVQVHPQFCQCACRQKWSPTSAIVSMEYNWPKIQGTPGFNTPAQYMDAYQWFLEEYKVHKDPVCSQAAVSYVAFVDSCPRWNFAINMNMHHESKQEFLIFLKSHYRPSRWVRVVEAMAIIHFIEGIHISLINEFPFTWARPFKCLLKWQRKNNPQAIAQDEHLQWVIIKMETKESKQRRGSKSQDYMEEEEGEDTEGHVKRLCVGRNANN